MYADGTQSEPQLHSIIELQPEWQMGRRGFLSTAGLGLGSAVTLAACGGGGGSDESQPVPSPAPNPAPQSVSGQCSTPATDIAAHLSLEGLDVAHNGQWIATAGDRVVKLWSLPAATLTRTLTSSNLLRRGPVSPSFSFDSRTIAAAGEDLFPSEYWVKIWDVESGALARTILGHTDVINCVAFGPDGTWLASGSSDETVMLFDVATGATIRTLDVGGTVEALAISGDGLFLACTSNRLGGWAVKVYQVASGALDQTLNGHDGPILDIAFSPDGRLIASASSDTTVRLWNRPLGSLVRVFNGHARSVNSVDFRPDGSQLASGSRDGIVKLWEVSSGRLLQNLVVEPSDAMQVTDVDFDPTGQWLAIGAGTFFFRQGENVLLWDTTTLQFLTCLSDLQTASMLKSFSTYTSPSVLGGQVTHTLPCGAALPQGAVCTCNCVFGTGTGSRGGGGGGGGGGGSTCTCNTVCTCVPVFR